MNIMKFQKMTTEDLKVKVEKYNKKINVIRIISYLIYAAMTIFLFAYLIYDFEFSTLKLFILLSYLLIFSATLSGFESTLSELYRVKEEMEITIYNRKEDDKWLKMQKR